MASPQRKATTGTFDPFSTQQQQNQQNSTLQDEFDPFEIGAGSSKTKRAAAIVSQKNARRSDGGASVSTKGSSALPPRMLVKFKLHEEVSSTALVGGRDEGSSEIFVEGTVLAQVTSSDALKNAPFVLLGTNREGSTVTVAPNDTFAKAYPSRGEQVKVNVIKIPKTTIGFVTVGKYHYTERIDHMPLLLERKISRAKNKVQVAVQVRSKLTNPDDLSEFCIVLSLSESVISESVDINTGKGDFDPMHRTVTWNLSHLPKGESFMVSVRGKVTDETKSSAPLLFPVMLRCRSNDKISTTEFQAMEASGYPANVSSTTVAHSFRIIHRLR